MLADKLIHDQVTRAQEAEETYALKNNLSTTKQKLADQCRKLEEAQVLIADIKDRVRFCKCQQYICRIYIKKTGAKIDSLSFYQS